MQPNREDEWERIEAAGGRIIQWNGYRVLGVLAVSRSIGMFLLCRFLAPNLYRYKNLLMLNYGSFDLAIPRQKISTESALTN